MPATNALNFPAAILQPPFFDPRRPLAADYGATGATIGHEISHSFDDQGALFDAQGRREKQREAALRRQLVTDGHAPAQYRTDTVRNLDAWYAAFPVRETDALYLAPPARVRVW